MFEFEWPWLFFLIPLPLLMRWVPEREKKSSALHAPFFSQVKHIQQENHFSQSSGGTKNILLWLIWFLCLCAAANPQWVGEPQNLPSSGRDLLIAVDISGSMNTEDMKDAQGNVITRVQAVKQVVGNFVETRKTDRLGLILFGTRAYLQAPLTYDKKSVHQLLNEAEIGFAGTETSIGDAIGLAIKRLKNNPTAQRVLILLTDGANTAGELAPIKAAELAQQEGVKIYTIGFGAEEMIVNNGFFGVQRVNPSADLDEKALTDIADKTQGKYFRARTFEDLTAIHQALNQLEPVTSDTEKFRPIKQLFYWPLGIALLLSALGIFIRNRNAVLSSVSFSHFKNNVHNQSAKPLKQGDYGHE